MKTWRKTLSLRELEKGIRKKMPPPNRVHKSKVGYSRKEKFGNSFDVG